MRHRFKSIKSKIILLFILLAVFQVSVMALFAKFHLEPSIVNMIGDSRIQSFLELADSAGDRSSLMSLTPELRNRILSYTDYDNIIQAIYLMDNQGHIYSNQGQPKMQHFLDENPVLKNRTEASAVWYTEEDCIVLYRIVNNNTTDLTRKTGALCIFIDKELFEERLNHLMMEENQHYLMEGSGRNFFLVSERNAVLNEGDIVSTREQDGWVLKTWIDKDTAYAPVNMLLRILMLELLILLGISVGLAVFLSGRITRPMRKIETAMQQIGEGNMDIVVQDQDQDEMGILAATLNNMSLNIKELMAQIHRDEEQKRYLQLKAMQYQVNPHFLYNTLDSIAMSARRNNDSTSEKMALALSEFFRLSLSHGMEYVTVSEEMRYVQSYLEIQSMRFPDSVTWECRIEPGLENIKVLKFILQPLAENSLYHGLRDSGREGHIDVSAYAVKEDLIFSVKDNGAGILPEQLEKLKEEINCRQATEKSIYEGGFGLQNVQQRLQLVYGEQAGLSIESEWDEGTCITVIIPGGKEQKEDEKSKDS